MTSNLGPRKRKSIESTFISLEPELEADAEAPGSKAAPAPEPKVIKKVAEPVMFNVRLHPDMHWRLKLQAMEESRINKGKGLKERTMKDIIEECIAQYLAENEGKVRGQ